MTDEELIARLRALDTWVETADVPDLAADRIEALVKENTALKEHVADMLAEQECGCGYDNPTDVCLGHLPLHRKTVARAEQLAATNEQLEAALRRIADTDPDEGTAWFHRMANAALEPVAALTPNPVDASQTPDPAVKALDDLVRLGQEFDAAPDPACDHCGMDPAAIREAALREAAAACEYVIKNIDILKADGETYETPRVQKIARGLVDVARQDILAIIPKGAADDR